MLTAIPVIRDNAPGSHLTSSYIRLPYRSPVETATLLPCLTHIAWKRESRPSPIQPNLATRTWLVYAHPSPWANGSRCVRHPSIFSFRDPFSAAASESRQSSAHICLPWGSQHMATRCSECMAMIPACQHFSRTRGGAVREQRSWRGGAEHRHRHQHHLQRRISKEAPQHRQHSRGTELENNTHTHYEPPVEGERGLCRSMRRSFCFCLSAEGVCHVQCQGRIT